MARQARFVAWGLALALSLACYLYFAGTGQFSDEGSFCTIGQGLLAGLLPYRDYFNEKPPLQYLWTAMVMSVGGTGIGGARLASTITLFLTLGLGLSQLARQRRPLLAMFAASLVVVPAGVLMKVYNNTAESSLALLFVATVVVLFNARLAERPALRAWLAGALLGLACGFRMTAALSALVVFATPWLAGARKPFAVGFASGLALWVGWLAAFGIFDEAMSAVLFFHWNNPLTASYFRGLDAGDRMAALAWILALFAGFIAAGERGDRRWVVLWAVAAAIPFFGRMDPFRLWPSTILSLAVLWSARDPRIQLRGYFLAIPMLLLGWLGFHGTNSFESTRQIVAVVARHSSPTDRIWVAPFSPSVYCLSGRASASRYYFVLPWTATPAVQARLMQDLRARPPALVVELTAGGFSLDALLPKARPWLERDYVLVETDAQARYWQRKTAPHRR